MSTETMGQRGWIGVDLDGTLAQYNGWQGIAHIGPPVPAMLARVKHWLAAGKDVRIFTARVSRGDEAQAAGEYIAMWMAEHGLPCLPITCTKDFAMIELWDDRAVQVVPNTGERIDERECDHWNED